MPQQIVVLSTACRTHRLTWWVFPLWVTTRGQNACMHWYRMLVLLGMTRWSGYLWSYWTIGNELWHQGELQGNQVISGTIFIVCSVLFACSLAIIMRAITVEHAAYATHGISNFFCTYDGYFYFYVFSTRKTALTTISVFLFTRQLCWYGILCITPSVFGITFFCTSRWWLRDCELDLWFVSCWKLRICFCIHVGIVLQCPPPLCRLSMGSHTCDWVCMLLLPYYSMMWSTTI